MNNVIIAFLIAAALGGCMNRDTAACEPPHRTWPFIPPGYSLDGTHYYVIGISPSGQITWGGGTINQHFDRKISSVDEVRRNVAIISRFSPRFHLILRPSEKPSCRAAAQVRAIMDAAPLCKEGYCAEAATWDQWKRLCLNDEGRGSEKCEPRLHDAYP